MFLFVLLFMLSWVTGCFDQKIAQGRYVESNHSGRWMIYRDLGLKDQVFHFFRFNLIQFDDETTGIVEIFSLYDHQTFELQPTMISQPYSHYFCSRIERGLSKDRHLTLRFVDQMNRIWQLNASFDDNVLSGQLYRVRGDGTLVENNQGLPDPQWLLPEDQSFWEHRNEIPESSQIELERQSDQIEDNDLRCVNYERRRRFEINISMDLPEHARLALLITRPIRALSDDQLDGLDIQEMLTATLDPDIDVVDRLRPLWVRMAPPHTYLQRGIAVATLVIYQDLPDQDGIYNNRWDALWDPLSQEPILAYTPRSVFVYNENEETLNVSPLNEQGMPIHNCEDDLHCLFEELRTQGWMIYDVQGEWWTSQFALLIGRFLGKPLQTIDLEMMPENCKLCYPKGKGECLSCPSIFPVLYL